MAGERQTGPERADAIPAMESALSAAVDALLKDSGLPQYGPHRATVERRQRLAFVAAAPLLPGGGEAEVKLRRQVENLNAAVDEARAEVKRLRTAAKRVLEADMRGVRDLDALNALEDAAGFSQQGQRRSQPDAERAPQEED